MALPALRDVWRLALPTGTLLVSGASGLDAQVLWARRMSVHAPAFGSLEAGEVALLSMEALALLDERLTLARVIAALADRSAAAVGLVGVPPDRAIQASNERGLPLFTLPEGADLRDVERDIIRLIVEHEAQVDRRRQEIHQKLTQISIESGGLGSIADALVGLAGKPVVIVGAREDDCTSSWPDDLGETILDLQRALTECDIALNRPSQRVDRGGSPEQESVPLGDSGWIRHALALSVEGEVVGNLSLLSETDLDDLERLALEQGGMACAVEIVKRRAVEAAEDRMRGDFLGALLTADNAREPALTRRASELGYDIEGHHCATVFSTDPDSSQSLALLASDFQALLLGTGIRAFICPHGGNLVALCNSGDPASLRQLDRKAELARARARERATLGGAPRRVAIGIGRPAPGLSGLRVSLAQAQEALELALSVFGGDRVLSFTDLGVYSVLSRLQGSDEMVEFYERTLGTLARYDAGRSTRLIATLEAYFANLCNVSQTAEALFLHRNSLLYRLERIRDITGLDLNEADDRFSLQLALRIRPFLLEPPTDE